MERPSIDGLTYAFTHMSIRCDPRALKDVPKHIQRALPPNQNILKLERERQVLYKKVKAKYGFINQARGTKIGEDYGKLVRKIGSERKKREEDLKKAYRRQYFYHIHNETLGIVLNKIETNDYVPPVV
jgi:hypothetical protein